MGMGLVIPSIQVSLLFDSIDDFVSPTLEIFAGNCRHEKGGCSAKSCPTAISKQARWTLIDSRRSKRIAAMTQSLPKDSDNDTSECTSSEDEYSDSDYSSNESNGGGSQELTEQQQQQIERKKELQQQTSALLLRLTRSLRTCKRNVDTLSPKVFRPNVSSLRAAIDSVLHVAERVKTVSISSTLVLKRLSQRAASIADLMYIPNGSYTSPFYCYLLRVRAILSLAMRVAAIMHGYAEMMASGNLVPQEKGGKEDSGVLVDYKESAGDMELADHPQQNKQENTQDVQTDEETWKTSMAGPHACAGDVATRKYTHISGKSRYATSEQSAKASLLAISREARKAEFDRRRSKRIATIMHMKSDPKESESESDDSNYSNDSEDEYSGDESDSSSEESSDDESEKVSELQQLEEKKKKMRGHISVFLLQLNKCLNSCKKEVYTLSPQLVRPSLSTLKEAVDNALYVTERIKGVSIKAMSALKRMIQTAATVARVVYIPDSMHSTATRSHYHSLLRTRRFLNLAMRVASVLHAFTEKLASGNFKQTKIPSDHESSHPDAKEKRQDVQAMELSSSKGCPNKLKNDFNERVDSDQKPLKLIVSVPLSKISSSPIVCKNGSVSMLPELQGPSPKLRASNCCRQAVLDDVVDVGIVKGNKPSPQGSCHDPEMINNLLWKVRREVVEKQRAKSRSNLLHRVQKQSVFKTTCKKKRFSALAQSAQERWSPKPEISIDELADLFGRKFKFSESVCITYANLSFKDPRQHELPSSVVPREKCPGIVLQDGGVNFVLRASPLTPVLLSRKLEIKDLNTPSDNLLKDAPVPDHEISKSITEEVTYTPTPASAETNGKTTEQKEELTQQGQPKPEEKLDPLAYLMPSQKVTRFLKPATLTYNSSFRREPVVSKLRKEQDSNTQSLQKIRAPPSMECNFQQKCKNSNITRKESQQVLAGDIGVVRENSASQQHVESDAGVDKVSENLSRCELVEKQSVTSKQNAVKSLVNTKGELYSKSSHKKRFSPYPCRPTSTKTSHSPKSEQTKHNSIQIQPPASTPQRENYPKFSAASTTSLSKTFNKSESVSFPRGKVNPMPSVDIPHALSVAARTQSSNLSSKPEEQKTALNLSAQQKPRLKPELSMDELANLFESKFKISDAITRRYSNLSFRDPCQHQLTSSVTHCRDQQSGIALQDGGVNFILLDSPLTEVVCKKLEEKDGLIILPQSLRGSPKPGKTSERGVNIGGGMSNKSMNKPWTVTTITATNIQKAIDAVMKKSPSRATLKRTRRRVHPNLSNILAARQNPRSECDTASETEEYRKMMGCNVEVSTVSKKKERCQRVRLGKRSATVACLPVPAGK